MFFLNASEATKTDTYHIDTSNVLFIFSGAFVGLDQIVKRRVAKGVGVKLKRLASLLIPSQSIGFTANISSENDSPGGPMSFFTPNSGVERSPSNILEQVQPVGRSPCLVASNASIHVLSRPNEIRVKQPAISKNRTMAQEYV